MNDLEQLVPSLDLCQKLKAAGFPQDTALGWVPAEEFDEYEVGENREPVLMEKKDTLDEDGGDMYEFTAAPTAEEILRELPWTLQPWLPDIHPVFLQVRKTPDGFRVAWLTWDNKHVVPCDDDKHYEKESEAVAHAYLWWKAQP